MERATWILLAIGTAIVCAYNDILAGVILLAVFIGIVAVLWVRFYASIIEDDAEERAEELAEERYQEMIDNAEVRVTVRQSIVCGKGFENAYQ